MIVMKKAANTEMKMAGVVKDKDNAHYSLLTDLFLQH